LKVVLNLFPEKCYCTSSSNFLNQISCAIALDNAIYLMLEMATTHYFLLAQAITPFTTIKEGLEME
jgi:hypothetical protein